MTFSNIRHQSPSSLTTNPAQTNEAYFAALAPSFRAVLRVGILLFSKLYAVMEECLRNNCDPNSKAFKIAALPVILFMIALPGTREEKNEFFDRMFERSNAKRKARLKELYAIYVVWRQRKCWMWGGGFMNEALAMLPDVFVSEQDQLSFDALIPD